VRSGRYTRTPFLGQHGWVSVVDFDRLDWAEIEELVTDAYRRTAPKRLRAQIL
jgi:predicted DNA-binding protein (MmcQ/YjbR family)